MRPNQNQNASRRNATQPRAAPNQRKANSREIKLIVNNELRKTAIQRQIPVQVGNLAVQNVLGKRWNLLFPLRAVLERLVDETDLTFDTLSEGIIYLQHLSYEATVTRFQEASNQAGERANLLSGAIFQCQKKNLLLENSGLTRFRNFIPNDTVGYQGIAIDLVSDEMCATASSDPNNFWDRPIEIPLYRNTGPSPRTWPLLSIDVSTNQRSGFGTPQPWQGNWATKVSRAPIWAQAPASTTYVQTSIKRVLMSPKEPKKIKVTVDPDGSKVRLSEEPVLVLAFDRTVDDSSTNIAGVSVVIDCILSVDL